MRQASESWVSIRSRSSWLARDLCRRSVVTCRKQLDGAPSTAQVSMRAEPGARKVQLVHACLPRIREASIVVAGESAGVIRRACGRNETPSQAQVSPCGWHGIRRDLCASRHSLYHDVPAHDCLPVLPVPILPVRLGCPSPPANVLTFQGSGLPSTRLLASD